MADFARPKAVHLSVRVNLGIRAAIARIQAARLIRVKIMESVMLCRLDTHVRVHLVTRV